MQENNKEKSLWKKIAAAKKLIHRKEREMDMKEEEIERDMNYGNERKKKTRYKVIVERRKFPPPPPPPHNFLVMGEIIH